MLSKSKKIKELKEDIQELKDYNRFDNIDINTIIKSKEKKIQELSY